MKQEIKRLIWAGVSEFYTGGQSGAGLLAALLVIRVRDELMTTANLHLVLPYRGMRSGFNRLQKHRFDRVAKSAHRVTCLNEGYTPGCYREWNRYMAERCDYIIGVADRKKPRNGAQGTLGRARRMGKKIVMIDIVTFEVVRES